MPDTPEFVLGAAIVRGVPTPIVDMGVLLAGSRLAEAGRWITAKAGPERRVGLQVSSVLGVVPADELSFHDNPSLLEGADPGVLELLGRRDAALCALLRTGSIVPDVVFEQLSHSRWDP
jgi:chemotaxis signal transduction protein